jgi:hypothetical protein
VPAIVAWPNHLNFFRLPIQASGAYRLAITGVYDETAPVELVLWVLRWGPEPEVLHLDERSGPIGNPEVRADLEPGEYIIVVTHRTHRGMARYEIRAMPYL